MGKIRKGEPSSSTLEKAFRLGLIRDAPRINESILFSECILVIPQTKFSRDVTLAKKHGNQCFLP